MAPLNLTLTLTHPDKLEFFQFYSCCVFGEHHQHAHSLTGNFLEMFLLDSHMGIPRQAGKVPENIWSNWFRLLCSHIQPLQVISGQCLKAAWIMGLLMCNFSFNFAWMGILCTWGFSCWNNGLNMTGENRKYQKTKEKSWASNKWDLIGVKLQV